jgi:hypothetical protein
MMRIAETIQRADEATGLEGEDPDRFHRDMIRELAKFGPIRGSVALEDTANEMVARYATAAEQLLGPELGQAYLEPLLSASDEQGRLYVQKRMEGHSQEEAAEAAGMGVDPIDAGIRPHQDL